MNILNIEKIDCKGGIMNGEVKRVGISGVGIYLPTKIITNFDLEKMVDTSDEWIRTRTGIQERRIAEDGIATSDLATIAAQDALKDAGAEAEDIDLIVVATATPDMAFPATACIVQDRLGAKGAATFDLLAGCTGFIYAVASAAQFVALGLAKKALVIGAETLSKITDWTDRTTCVVFGDGAGAVVLEEVEGDRGILGIDLGADGSGGDLLKLPGGLSRYPASHKTVDEKLHFVKMSGNEVFKFAVRIMGESSLRALNRCSISPEGIDLLIPHQANIRIIKAAANRLGVPMSKVFTNVHKYGNTSAASIPIALKEALQEDRIKEGDILVLTGFGAGLTWGSLVIRW